MSSYIFNLKPTRSRVRPLRRLLRETKAEKIWIGGGAGMAPLRSQMFDELKREEGRREDVVLVRRALAEGDVHRGLRFAVLAVRQLRLARRTFSPLPEDNWAA